MTQGQIFKIHSDFYYIDNGEQYFECKAREVLKKQQEKIFVGDFVEFENGFINKILPRKNYIPRPSVANIDQIILVSALKEPEIDLLQLNRYIAFAKYYNIPTILCFNKEDLKFDKKLKANILNIYEKLGYKILFTSAKEHQGIEIFKKILNNKISVLCGTSGVGKSSLINSISPEFNLRTKSVSEKTHRGTHTTRHCEIIKINPSSKIVDTPGFSNLKFDFILPSEVDKLFIEMQPYIGACKYSDCLHINEDGCEILNHFQEIDDTRYESYLAFVDEAREYKEKIKYEGKKIEQSKKIINNRTVAKISERKRTSARNTIKQNIYNEVIEDE